MLTAVSVDRTPIELRQVLQRRTREPHVGNGRTRMWVLTCSSNTLRGTVVPHNDTTAQPHPSRHTTPTPLAPILSVSGRDRPKPTWSGAGNPANNRAPHDELNLGALMWPQRHRSHLKPDPSFVLRPQFLCLYATPERTACETGASLDASHFAPTRLRQPPPLLLPLLHGHLTPFHPCPPPLSVALCR
jgi:hypothetical protein